MQTTRTYLWVDDYGKGLCADHAYTPELRQQFLDGEIDRRGIVFDAFNSWMMVDANDAAKVGITCRHCHTP